MFAVQLFSVEAPGFERGWTTTIDAGCTIPSWSCCSFLPVRLCTLRSCWRSQSETQSWSSNTARPKGRPDTVQTDVKPRGHQFISQSVHLLSCGEHLQGVNFTPVVPSFTLTSADAQLGCVLISALCVVCVCVTQTSPTWFSNRIRRSDPSKAAVSIRPLF